MRVTIHKITKEKEAKIIVYQGIIYKHVIIFLKDKDNKPLGHYQVINKIKKHFPINDNTCQAGWIINGRQEFFSKEMVNERIDIANKKGVKC